MTNSLEVCIWKLIVKKDVNKPEQLRIIQQHKSCLDCDGYYKECSNYFSFGELKIDYLKYKLDNGK